ncbi:divergent polysaccharide deacetylase family protein [Anaerocellum diazotrophicum]|uniref:divergent polysaccharide deacetylase family protein n=1 Tax=Caldicellulosiruptor diazotrophicus TaxID=2806205 RepID=UPI001A924751|nr:divergent polysaccharide deacetylase family protein [Caldicellulosiruptor diazotrophicus]
MKFRRYILVIIEKTKLSKFFIPFLALLCSAALLLVYLFYNPKPKIKEVANQTQSYVAIIFEDAGMDEEEVQKLLSINVPFDIAIIPFLPFSNKISLASYEKGKEVILHLSMEPEDEGNTWLCPRSIMNSTPDDEIEKILKDALANVVNSKGLSIHLGTLVCKNERIVKKLSAIAKENNLFIVDSTFSSESSFSKIGKQIDLDVVIPDIVLDLRNELKPIEDRFDILFNTAKKKGFAIAIGHLGTEGGITTIEAFKQAIQKAEKENIKFVFVSEILKIQKEKIK